MRAPINAARYIILLSSFVNFLISWTIIIYKNIIESALAIGETKFTLAPKSFSMGICAKKFPINRYNGVPGGCGTPKIIEVDITLEGKMVEELDFEVIRILDGNDEKFPKKDLKLKMGQIVEIIEKP